MTMATIARDDARASATSARAKTTTPSCRRARRRECRDEARRGRPRVSAVGASRSATWPISPLARKSPFKKRCFRVRARAARSNPTRATRDVARRSDAVASSRPRRAPRTHRARPVRAHASRAPRRQIREGLTRGLFVSFDRSTFTNDDGDSRVLRARVAPRDVQTRL